MPRWPLTLLVLLLPMLGRAAEFKVGDEIFLKPDAEATLDGAIVDIKKIGLPVRIVQVDAERLFIRKAWIPTSAAMTADEALEFFNERVQQEPGQSMHYVNRGRVYGSKNDLEKAIEDFNQAIKLDPGNSLAYRARGLAWAKSRDLNKAIRDSNRAVQLDQHDGAAYLHRALIRQIKQEMEPAVADSTESIKLDPTEPLAYLVRGGCWQTQGQFGKALEDFDRCVKIDPNLALAWRRIAWIQATCIDPQYRRGAEAVEIAAKSCELTHYERWECLDSLAAALAESGDFANAIKWQTRTIELYPLNDKREVTARLELYQGGKPYRDETVLRYWMSHGSALEQRGEYSVAIKDYTEAIRLSPADSKFYARRGYCYATKGEFNLAHDDLNEALKLNPNHAPTYYNRGCVRVSLNDDLDAIRDYTEAIRLDEKYADAYRSRGNTWLKIGDFPNAERDLDSALWLNPDHALTHNSIAWLQATCPDERFRNGKKAVEHATKACELSHWNNRYCIGTLAAACAETGDFATAIKWQKKAIDLSSKSEKPDATAALEFYEANKPFREYSK